MYSEDKDNYGTPFSYATKSEDNEVMRMKQYDVRMMSHIDSAAHHHGL